MEEKVIEIISKTLGGQQTTNEEKRQLDLWLDKESNKRFYTRLEMFCKTSADAIRSSQANVDQAFKKHLGKMKQLHATRRMQFFKKSIPYAAAILLMFGLSSVAIYLGREGATVSQKEEWLAEIKPGAQKAELILADGNILSLDEEDKEDEIKEKDGTVISNTGSSLVYKANVNTKPKELSYNSLVVPRGGEYQLELEDGTKVWINSESRLRYPTQFPKDRRTVLLEGEAYFEVSKDKNRPFVVKTQGADIRVLGTSFNVSSYSDEEDIRTTLVEGSVVVMDSQNHSKNVLLSPGYQAVYSKGMKGLEGKKVNVDLFTSWKDGKFIFQESSLSDIMNRVSRWYDVKVFYQSNDVEKLRFTGSLKRYDHLDRLLRMLEKTKEVHFVVGEKTITVEKIYSK
ncbi:DUF4974 domain-containing protein [Ancylomarina salipaludis]|uniref:DUF4974 domain-containing protein n=1 Tax=Ancylomarina salipaludis TaxID=2501299 RepID=A0A4Q1JKE6_9BACT|nr:FecR domain-containing protein [Ancylomarina salipaludis]RXQ90957.1 DUF4974 domain-containing protein [Ancylomarina salipaludis]